MDNYKEKEYMDLYGIYVMAQKMFATKRMIDFYHMNDNLRLDSYMSVLIKDIVEYNTKFGVNHLAEEEHNTIMDSYDFLKNKNVVSSQEDK